jgi:hypothetical protein
LEGGATLVIGGGWEGRAALVGPAGQESWSMRLVGFLRAGGWWVEERRKKVRARI